MSAHKQTHKPAICNSSVSEEVVGRLGVRVDGVFEARCRSTRARQETRQSSGTRQSVPHALSRDEPSLLSIARRRGPTGGLLQGSLVVPVARCPLQQGER